MAKKDALSVQETGALQVKGEKGAKSPPSDVRMSISGHLVEIKSRLTRVILAFVVGVIAGSFVVEPIMSELIRTGKGFSFIYIDPGELVGSYIKVVLIISLVLSAPVILYQIWGFVRPALEANEKRMGLFALLGGTGFFIVGMVFAYLVAAPFTINFFVNFDTTGLIKAQISIKSYIDFTGMAADKVGEPLGGKDNGPVCLVCSLVTLPVGLVAGTLKGVYYGTKNGVVGGFNTPFHPDTFSLGELDSE
jgi:hypothetical protein